MPVMSERLAPALRHLASARTDLAPEVLGAVRESLNERRRAAAADLDTSGVDITDDVVDAGPGHAVAVRIYRSGPASAPSVIYCHSGAFVLGNLDTDHLQCVELCRQGDCTVISVDYRLAPEHPYPAAFDDAMSVLRWAADHADALRVDAARLAVAGSSAGGALAALLAQACRQTAGIPEVVFQLLHQPVLDDRPMPSKAEFTTTPGFDRRAVADMWRHYLAGEVIPAAAPGRNEDLAGVAPAMITCSELDPLRDEAVDYALRLMWAGVSAELHVFPATCHGFDSLVPEWETSRQLFALQGAALRRALWPENRSGHR